MILSVRRLGMNGMAHRNPRDGSNCTVLTLSFGGYCQSVHVHMPVRVEIFGGAETQKAEESLRERALGLIRYGERLLGLIRCGLLTASPLEEVGLRAEERVGEGLGARLRALSNEALALQRLHQLPLVKLLQQLALKELQQRCAAAAREGQEGSLLCSRAFEPRKGTDVARGEYAVGRRQHRVVRDEGDARVLCECRGRFFGWAFMDLLEWDASTLKERRRLRCEGQIGALMGMTAYGDLVIGGYSDKCLRVWNTATGGCDHVL